MPTTRTKIASAVASASVLFVGWQVGTHDGQAQAIPQTTTATSTTTTTTASATEPNEVSTASQTSAAGSDPNTGSSSGTATTAAASGNGTYTGSAESNPYGTTTVTIRVADGKITEVTADGQSNDHHSEEINSYAIPTLREEVLAAQSAEIDTVSGATFTTESYRASLQAALDQVK